MHVALHRLRLLPRSTLLQPSDLPRGHALRCQTSKFAHLVPRTSLPEREHMIQLHEPDNPLERVNARQFVSVHDCIFGFFVNPTLIQSRTQMQKMQANSTDSPNWCPAPSTAS